MNLFAEEYLQHEKEIEAALQDVASLRKAKNSLTKLRNEAKQELVELARQALQVLQNLPLAVRRARLRAMASCCSGCKH